MKKASLFIFCIIFSSFIFTGCTDNKSTSNEVKVEGNFYKSGSTDENYVELNRINDTIWVHASYTNYNGSRTSSNGVVAVTSKGILLIDTPWTNGQTKELLKLTKNVFNKDVTLAVITHAHDDRIGGIDTLLERNVDVRSTELTLKEAEKYGYKKPQAKLNSDTKVTLGNLTFETFYPGEGHSIDNITVWFPKHKVLFGGCLIKSMESTDLGSTKDANTKQWPISAKSVLERYPDAGIVIPGHGKWGGLDLVNHTLDLFKSK